MGKKITITRKENRTNLTTDYDFQSIEAKWQRKWQHEDLYRVQDKVNGKPNWYALTMFPYPSGDLHIGHWFAFAPADAHARFKRMQGHNVMHPQGFDAFGLPAENAAISRGINPRKWTLDNIDNMRRQFHLMGTSYDWNREFSTCLPEYYRWNQFFFLKFYERNIAYRKDGSVNWCPKDQTTLANEQVKDGDCERCGTKVLRREMPQWYFRITDYADELLRMEQIEWPEKIKTMQRNWIGKSTGTTISFEISDFISNDKIEKTTIETFTTRIDTVWGVTFIVLAPEHPLVAQITKSKCQNDVTKYINEARAQSEIERTSTDREKSGAFTGSYAINPLNNEHIPIFIGDYVLSSYGTGAVMGVPAHDQRDFIFAKKYDLPIRVVIAPKDWNGDALKKAYLGTGTQVNSGEFNGLANLEAIDLIADKIEISGWGKRSTTYHLRDWLISRQRYWGTPIPMIHCDACGIVPVPIDDLPVLLPEDVEFTPTGQSPLKLDESFVNTPCPECGSDAQRETDTMDTFVDSSWYHLRFTSPKSTNKPFENSKVANWAPVHMYMGGAEHAVMHLLYARFFNKALRDIGYVNFDEPYTRLFNQGTLTRDHMKISKRANPLNPEPIVEQFGTDTLRCYLMFLGPWDQGGDWSDQAINGIHRWMKRLWDLCQKDINIISENHGQNREPFEKELQQISHSVTKKIIREMEEFKFNTTIATLMQYTNQLLRFWENRSVNETTWKSAIERLLKHLAPLAPHISEELWERAGYKGSIHLQELPEWDESKALSEKLTIVVQVNGKVRDRLEMNATDGEDRVLKAALSSEKIQKHLQGYSVTKNIFVPNRLLNIVARPEP